MALKLTCGKGAENLDADDRLVLDRLTNEYSEKITRHIGKEPDYFEIHLKCHLKEGNTKRYAIEARIGVDKFRFEAKTDEWILSDAIHILMKKLMSEIEHKITKKKEDKLWKGKARR